MSKALLELKKFKDFIPVAAYIFAEAAHAGQFRADNKTPYIEHVAEVAFQLDKFGIKFSGKIPPSIVDAYDCSIDSNTNTIKLRFLSGTIILFISMFTKLSAI